MARKALAHLLHPAHCEQRLALAFERLKRSVGSEAIRALDLLTASAAGRGDR
jgi:hypothetical protein